MEQSLSKKIFNVTKQTSKDVFNQNIFIFENFRLVRLNEQKMKKTDEREIKDDLRSDVKTRLDEFCDKFVKFK